MRNRADTSAISPRPPRRLSRTLAAGVAALALVGAGCTEDSDGGGAATGAAAVIDDRSPGVHGGIELVPIIARDVGPSVVAIAAGAGEGSGVVFDRDGVVVTNAHVVAGADVVEVVFADGSSARAAVVARDRVVDVAVLRVDREGLPAASFADELPEVGELAVAIGNPLGFEHTVTAGVVSGLHRSIPGSAGITPSLVDLIQTDAPISPGNSGGALVNADGEVVGLNVAYIPPQARAVSIGFAVPAATVVETVGELLDDGVAEHAWLGLIPAQVTEELAGEFGLQTEDGVLVRALDPGGPAASGGLEVGDVITAIDGEDVATVEDLLAALRSVEPGDLLDVRVERAGRRETISVVAGARPVETG